MQRFKFNSRNRQPNETVADYVAVLRELAQHCNYGEKLKEMLCDRLVGGIEADGVHSSAHHFSDSAEATASDRQEVFTMYSVVETQIPRVSPITMFLKVNDTEVNFEVDTGWTVTIKSKTEYAKLGSVGKLPDLKDCSFNLKTYMGESVKILGTTDVMVRYGNQVRELPVVVVSTEGPNLLGRGWIKELDICWSAVNQVNTESMTLQDVLSRYEAVFKEGLGTWTGPPAKIHVDKDAVPRYYKPRPVPYALKKKVEVELERLLNDKILKPVKFSEWAAPIVPVLMTG
ncbi:putative protein K02A2.6-like protein [Labeo rohita]|uniref:Retrovirus-related Pol poly from transposon n=1 Tax=Labeo rohita TaxID=84645 RepID=A0A498LGV4_LABRO|nr:putative protein K02A2.6-like protein [Labeo rohita]